MQRDPSLLPERPLQEHRGSYLPGQVSRSAGCDLDWAEPYLKVTNADVLDFGCGEATTALGFALRKGVRRVVGVDVVSDPNLCLPYAHKHLGLTALPGNLELHRVPVGSLHNEEDRLRSHYAWSVMEHVREDLLDSTLSMLRARSRRGGLIFVQVSPLYYSSEGSHLFHKIPERWGHLRHQHSEYLALLRNACSEDAEYRSLVETYEGLNRITAERLRTSLENAGFLVLREHHREEAFAIPQEVTDCYVEKVLRLAEVAILSQNST